MKYYLMRQDTKAQEVPHVINWFKEINVEAMESERYEELPKITVLETKTAPNTHYKELILNPFLLLPKEAGTILKAFEPWMAFKTVVLWDSTKKKNHKYIFPLLQRYDCLSRESILNRDRTVLEKGVLKQGDIPDQVLFMPAGVRNKLVIGREDFIEALLQNEFLGYSLTELEMGE